MRSIKKFVDAIDEELEGAKEYAEKFVEHKAQNDMQTAQEYYEMANDELRHANIIHGFAVAKINEIGKVFTAPVEMEEAWKKSHKEYVERVAWIKQMLAM
jgi:hypothetical protein